MSFSGLRPIFTIGDSAGTVCGSYEPHGLCGAPADGLAETICGFSKAARAAASARGGPHLRCRFVRALRRLLPTVEKLLRQKIVQVDRNY